MTLPASVLLLWSCLTAVPLKPRTPDTLPAQYTDAEFWRFVSEFSEPGGRFPYENFVSNEVNYQSVIPEVRRRTTPGGVYLGVAPEQNFTYIAAIQPKVSFIFDIRRQNLVELLMYKALFEMSTDRADFVSQLFSRRRPAGLGTGTSARALFDAFERIRPDSQLYNETLAGIKDRLVRQHGFKLSADDQDKIGYIFRVFFEGGPRMDYAYASASPNRSVPSYYALMTGSDSGGTNWAYLADEVRFRYIRDVQQRNLIIPIVGDFSGPRAIKTVAAYLKEHGAAVTVFYISNVEDYLEPSWSGYRSNIQSLPVEENALFIRFVPQSSSLIRSLKDLPIRWPGRSW
ncbi:MAG TPA: hypothetical protein VK210_05185 [Terriglobia bacterium]|nr:hypothetical protein [Terriglobia bacterium]